MSVVPNGTFSGRFVSDGTPKFIQLPMGCDWMEVQNQTVSYAAGADTGAEFRWALGDVQGRGTIYNKTTTTNALTVGQIAANSGFFLQNTTSNIPGAPVALTAISNATPPLVSTGNTAGLIANESVVRIYNTIGAQQLGGMDFTVGTIVANTSFTLAYADNIVAATNGTYRIIPYNPYWYPSTRMITKITQATQAIVTLAVTNIYTIGQRITFVIPTITATAYGMTELNGVTATIVAVGEADADGITNTITVDVDTTSFTPFAFPLTTDYPVGRAVIVPAGMNTAEANAQNVNPFKDSQINQASIGMLLMAGTGSPAGVNNDVITWVAGKSYNQ
jgi:hypothetical protein